MYKTKFPDQVYKKNILNNDACFEKVIWINIFNENKSLNFVIQNTFHYNIQIL